MAKKQITHYKLAWDLDDNRGTIRVKYETGKEQFVFSEASSFLAAAAIIQHEAPVYYDTAERVIFCGAEDVDDG